MNLKKWENAASVTFWSNKLQEKKRTVGKSDVKLCSVENREIEPVVEERIEEIRNQLLGLGDEDYEIDQETVKENGKPEEDSTCISKKEKILDEKLKKIDEVFKMVSEINRNGPTRGLSPIPLREQTPPLRQRSASRRENQLLLPPIRHSCRRHRPINKRTNNWREMKWRRARTFSKIKIDYGFLLLVVLKVC